MTREESKTQPSLHKYMRRRKLVSKSGFYLEIKVNGEVSCTRDESSIYSSLLFLSVGPNFVAIVGEQAKRYLAVDVNGKVFTTMSERKECVFREFLGRNFFSLFRTCHSDSKGRGWYLSLDEMGKIKTEKVSYSNEPQLHFLVKVVKEKYHKKLYENRERKTRATRQLEDEPVWVRRSSESSYRSRSRSSSPGIRSGRSSSASPASTISGLSEYGSPVGFLYGRPGITNPACLSEYGSPLPFPEHSGTGTTSPVSVTGHSEYGSPLPFPQHSGVTSPVSMSGRSEYGSPLPFPQHSGVTSPVSMSGRSEYGSPLPFPQHSGVTSPVSMSGRSEYGRPLTFPQQSGATRSPVSMSGRSEYGSPIPFPQQSGPTRSPVSITGRSEYGSPILFPQESGPTRSPVSITGRSEYGSPIPFPQHSSSVKSPSTLGVHSAVYGNPTGVSMSHRSIQTSPVNVPDRSGQNSPGSTSSKSSSSLSSKGSVRFGKIYKDTPC